MRLSGARGRMIGFASALKHPGKRAFLVSVSKQVNRQRGNRRIASVDDLGKHPVFLAALDIEQIETRSTDTASPAARAGFWQCKQGTHAGSTPSNTTTHIRRVAPSSPGRIDPLSALVFCTHSPQGPFISHPFYPLDVCPLPSSLLPPAPFASRDFPHPILHCCLS